MIHKNKFSVNATRIEATGPVFRFAVSFLTLTLTLCSVVSSGEVVYRKIQTPSAQTGRIQYVAYHTRGPVIGVCPPSSVAVQFSSVHRVQFTEFSSASGAAERLPRRSSARGGAGGLPLLRTVQLYACAAVVGRSGGGSAAGWPGGRAPGASHDGLEVRSTPGARAALMKKKSWRGVSFPGTRTLPEALVGLCDAVGEAGALVALVPVSPCPPSRLKIVAT